MLKFIDRILPAIYCNIHACSNSCMRKSPLWLLKMYIKLSPRKIADIKDPNVVIVTFISNSSNDIYLHIMHSSYNVLKCDYWIKFRRTPCKFSDELNFCTFCVNTFTMCQSIRTTFIIHDNQLLNDNVKDIFTDFTYTVYPQVTSKS